MVIRFVFIVAAVLALAGCGGSGSSSTANDTSGSSGSSGSGGSSGGSSTPAPTVTLSASSASIASGGTSTLTWSSTNATSCTASGGWSGSQSTSGTHQVGPLTASATYTLSCSGGGGSAQQSATVTVTGGGGGSTPAPTVTLSASPTSVATNGTPTLTWSSTNATSCTASGGWSGTKATSGSAQVGPLTNSTDFGLTCSGAGGSMQQTVTVTVNDVGGAITGHVDSSFIDLQGDNRVYVFAGSVTPHDDRGSGDAQYKVAVVQDANACTFSYTLTGVAAGTYTVAFTKAAQNDNATTNDNLTFSGTTTVTVAAAPVTHDFNPATKLQVGPGKTYATVAAAAAAAANGAVIEVAAGTYNDDIIVWGQNNITVRGVGGYAHINGTAVIPFVSGDPVRNGKGLWVVDGSNIRIENMEFSGAKVTDQNGAGIRNEGTNLTVCNGYFHDNENGFLGGAYGQLTVEYSTFANNGIGDGFTHNIYVDDGGSTGDKLVFRHNYSHHAKIGHTLKTRARENYILYNSFMDQADGTSSYNIDVPNGGLTYIIGNLIQQGPNTDNPEMIAFGEEGLSSGRTQSVYLVNNTMVNDRGSGTFVDVANGTTTFRSINNLFVFAGTLYSGMQPQATTNLATSSPGLVSTTTYDYHLTSSSPAVNAGTAPGSVNSYDLTPAYQYVQPAEREVRPVNGTIDVGAYEYKP